MSVVVTGAGGFIGGATVDAARADGRQVVGVGRTSGRHVDETSDLADPSMLTDLLLRNAAESVVHCAWAGHPRSADITHAGQITGNISSTLNTSLAAGLAGVRHLVFISSGGGRRTSLADGTPAPPYGWAKAVAASSVLATAEAFGFTATVLRPTAVYGPGQDPDKRLGVVSVFTARLLRGEPLEVIGSAATRRDFLHVADLAELVLLCIDRRVHGEFDVGGPELVSVDEVITALRRTTDIEPEVITVPGSGVDPEIVRLDNAAITAATGWQPRRTLGTALPEVIVDSIARLGLGERHHDLVGRLSTP